MVNRSLPCEAPQTLADKSWPYYEYYVGEKDHESRKNGCGRYHWSGAESLECYKGNFLRDTMHGIGVYRCRHRVSNSLAVTYEGNFYNNSMHGYGRMSYADGRVFIGLYHSNLRWGPGIESYACLRENVGLWDGVRIVRLSWKPQSVVPDLLSTTVGRDIAAQKRSILTPNTRIIGEVNSALELLKQHGAPPLIAALKWIKLYPKNCTDPKSLLYHADMFDRVYYDDIKIDTLELCDMKLEENKDHSHGSDSTIVSKTSKFYAWNDNEKIIHMMKHCYQHEKQRSQTKLLVDKILNGPRLSFKPPAQHELDSRTVLMASYLGHVKVVAKLINENDVHPNITDMQGNSALMYAACGNNPDVIHFLVEAGASINDYNDACCTPLGAALINYVCVYFDIPPNRILEAILPHSSTITAQAEQVIISEWNIERHSTELYKSLSSKIIRSHHGLISKKPKTLSSASLKINKVTPPKDIKRDTKTEKDYDELFSDDKHLYLNMFSEYNTVVNEIHRITGVAPVRYLFEINDMVKEIDVAVTLEEQKKVPDKKDMKVPSKVIKDTKLSRDLLALSMEKKLSLHVNDEIITEHLNRIMLTITQLLQDGADPCKVFCPQPALFFAIISQNSKLVRELVTKGADVNEVYLKSFDYKPIDIAISGPLSEENAQVIRTLLENGANVNHVLPINDPDGHEVIGPNLLHAILSKKVVNTEMQEDILHEIIELLLAYGCDPTVQYKGRSALDIAMSRQGEIFDIFIENPHTNLNAIINNLNQTVLVKMFYLPYCKTISVADRLQMLTNLLIYGADPLLKFQNEEQIYNNLFEFTNQVVFQMDKVKQATTTKQDPKKIKSEVKSKKTEKPKSSKSGQTLSKPSNKVASGDDVGDYKQVLNLATDCARLLFIRWIQAQLMKELIQIVNKYKHRHWNMILREYQNNICCNLWLNPVRCLEIWSILNTTQKRIYNDRKLLKYVLCIVLYHCKNRDTGLFEHKLSAKEKASIESEVTQLIHEHASGIVPQVMKRPYVSPELTPINEIAKFNICFECAMPLIDAKIPCDLCKLVDFCSFECMEANIERFNCHPCSEYLKKTYFPTPTHSSGEISKEIIPS